MNSILNWLPSSTGVSSSAGKPISSFLLLLHNGQVDYILSQSFKQSWWKTWEQSLNSMTSCPSSHSPKQILQLLSSQYLAVIWLAMSSEVRVLPQVSYSSLHWSSSNPGLFLLRLSMFINPTGYISIPNPGTRFYSSTGIGTALACGLFPLPFEQQRRTTNKIGLSVIPITTAASTNQKGAEKTSPATIKIQIAIFWFGGRHS